MEQEAKTLSNREQIIELLSRLHPESDLHDEEVLYGHILDDYTQYAQVLDEREQALAEAHAEGELQGRNAKIEEIIESRQAKTDGLPVLGGANTSYQSRSTSIFDIARGC